MRYKLRLVKSLKNNYVNLPEDSPLKQALAGNHVNAGASTWLGSDTSHCQAIKVTALQNDVTHYFGYVGGKSEEPNTIELSYDAGRLLGFEADPSD